MKRTDQLLVSAREKLPRHTANNAISYIASFFSVVFSLSLAQQAQIFIEEKFVLYLVIIFVVLFLVFNEYHKVLELRRRFIGVRSSLFVIVFTFMVNLVMSGIGIYLWTNKTFDKKIAKSNAHTSAVYDATESFNSRLDSLANLSVVSDPVYSKLDEELRYWKGRSAATLEERSSIREEVSKRQSELDIYVANFEKKRNDAIANMKSARNLKMSSINTHFDNQGKVIERNNWIAMVFFTMVIVTKLIIIFLAKEWSNIERKRQEYLEAHEYFLIDYRILTEVRLRKDTVEFNDILFSKFRPRNSQDLKAITKDIYYRFGQLGINGNMPLTEAQNKLKQYYENTLNL